MGNNLPPSIDIPEFRVVDGKVVLFCIICREIIGNDVLMIPTAIQMWRDHQAKKAEVTIQRV